MSLSGSYKVRFERGLVKVALHGEFDIVESVELEQALLPLVQSPGAVIVVDLSDVQFFGSCALRALLAAERAAGGAGATLRVVDPSSCCRHVFEIAGVSQHL